MVFRPQSLSAVLPFTDGDFGTYAKITDTLVTNAQSPSNILVKYLAFDELNLTIYFWLNDKYLVKVKSDGTGIVGLKLNITPPNPLPFGFGGGNTTLMGVMSQYGHMQLSSMVKTTFAIIRACNLLQKVSISNFDGTSGSFLVAMSTSGKYIVAVGADKTTPRLPRLVVYQGS